MGETEETDVEPTPEAEEEPEENFTRSGGRRASNLGRNREVASKELPSGNKLAESKLTETEKDVFDIIDEWHKSYPDHKMEYVEWLKINYPKEFEALKNSIKSYDNKVEENKLTEDEDLSYIDSDKNNCKVYYAVNSSGYKSLGLIVNDKDKKFQVVAGQKLRTGSKTAKKSKKQIWDMAKELKDNGYEEVRGPSSVAGKVEESKLIEAPAEEDEEFKKLCAEIEFQADENDFTLTKEDVKGIAKKLIADKFFFSHDIFADENDEEAWGEINDLIVSAIEAYPNKIEETQVRDGANNIIKSDGLSNMEYEKSLNSMLADKIADAAEELGDDYSEWLGENEILEIIDNIVESDEWREFETTIDRLVSLFVQDKVDQIRSDDPASKYYAGNLEENKEIKTESIFTIDDVLENLKTLVGKNVNDIYDDVIMYISELFDTDYEIIFKESENSGYDYIAYPNTDESDIQFLFTVDEDNKITDVWYTGNLEENKEIKTEKKIVIDNMGETYTIDTDAKTYTVKTSKGEKTFTFDEMNEFVKQARGMNRMYKPMSLLAYTDFKNNALGRWGIKNENGSLTEANKKQPKCVFELTTENPEDFAGMTKINVEIDGIDVMTEAIGNAVLKHFGGLFKDTYFNEIMGHDMNVIGDLWLDFVEFDEKTNTAKYVLDGDVTQDPELRDDLEAQNTVTESVTSKEYDDILLAIDQADSMEELQDIIYAVTDDVVEDEMQSMYDTCLKDGDNLGMVKDMLTAIFEDNTDIKE